MSLRIVVDIEANGLYQEVTKIHCVVAKDVDTGVVHKYHGEDNVVGIPAGLVHLQQASLIYGHNFIDYDMRVIEKLSPVKLDVNKIIDTMLLSYMLDPHRGRHIDCPPSQVIGDKRKPIGPHSLKNWGYICGRGKVEHEDWETFTPEMLHRCVEDVEITELVAKKLGVL